MELLINLLEAIFNALWWVVVFPLLTIIVVVIAALVVGVTLGRK